MASPAGGSSELDAAERKRLEALRSAKSLAELVQLTDASSEHAAYFEAKQEWHDLRDKELMSLSDSGGLPGDCVVVDGQEFCVHGITHADTAAEREYLQSHITGFLDEDEAVFCEQGIRAMYFSDCPDVEPIDDYRWAMTQCTQLDETTHIDEFHESDANSVAEEIDILRGYFRSVAFSLIDSGSGLYGEEYTKALGDIASSFLSDHEDIATGTDFASFVLSERAAESPEKYLRDLQTYYMKAFLPQPLEREWLQRHDPELELVTHARNERMTDYVIFHAPDSRAVHLIAGAAHQPGIVYYLTEHRDGVRTVADFEPTP